ncbi:MAG: NAD(P)/FAD-dependent oxidoreductase [Oscillospiraceae bacterium]|nr:NAD(P)/FAD-dependent oxidoreductase [Oscillospiraceae bacterium]
MEYHDLVIIGGGIAGLSTAINAYMLGIKDILIIERENFLGGILNECLEIGNAKNMNNDNLTGTEYIYKFIRKINELNIKYKLNTTVLEVTRDKIIKYINGYEGVNKVSSKVLLISVGCKEKSLGAINITNSKCAGIYSYGTVQKFLGLDGHLPGREILIYGCNDMSILMARRLILEGAEVKCILESNDEPRCTKDALTEAKIFGVKIITSTILKRIIGKERVEGVYCLNALNESLETLITCDCVIFSLGFQPDFELIKNLNLEFNIVNGSVKFDKYFQTEIEGIFICGNAAFIHENIFAILEETSIIVEKIKECIER